MSSPLLQRTVVVMSASSSTDWKARMRGNGGRWNVEPSQSLKGIRLTLAFTPRNRRASRRASSTPSLTPSSITYSKNTRCRWVSGYFRTASMSADRFQDLFTGMSCDLTSSEDACSETARLTLRSSRPISVGERVLPHRFHERRQVPGLVHRHELRPYVVRGRVQRDGEVDLEVLATDLGG